METINEKKVKTLIYDMTKEEVLKELDNINSAELLHIYINNYNWDNGFEIPKKILSKSCCELSTALLIFYLADGEMYLKDKQGVLESNLTEWASFLQTLYNQIVSGKFKEGNIFFTPPLSKIQVYKMNKNMEKREEVFVKTYGNKHLDIIL